MAATDMERAMRRLALAGGWIDPINRAKALYVSGEIDIEEFERQVEVLLSDKPVAWLEPGERVLTASPSA